VVAVHGITTTPSKQLADVSTCGLAHHITVVQQGPVLNCSRLLLIRVAVPLTAAAVPGGHIV
jgi:hypothetical protein